MASDYALITGSSKGLGRVLANVFSDNGYNLVIHGRNEEQLGLVKQELEKKGSIVEVVSGSLTDKETIERLGEAAYDKNISVLVNNAAETTASIRFSDLEDKFIEDMIYTNLTAPMLLTRRIYDHFLEKGSGNIININSVFSLETKKNSVPYTSSKHGVRGFTNALRLEAEENNIGVMEVYLTKVLLPGGGYGMDANEVASIIYDNFRDPEYSELFIEGRPEEFKPKEIERKDNIKTIEAKNKS